MLNLQNYQPVEFVLTDIIENLALNASNTDTQLKNWVFNCLKYRRIHCLFKKKQYSTIIQNGRVCKPVDYQSLIDAYLNDGCGLADRPYFTNLYNSDWTYKCWQKTNQNCFNNIRNPEGFECREDYEYFKFPDPALEGQKFTILYSGYNLDDDGELLVDIRYMHTIESYIRYADAKRARGMGNRDITLSMERQLLDFHTMFYREEFGNCMMDSLTQRKIDQLVAQFFRTPEIRSNSYLAYEDNLQKSRDIWGSPWENYYNTGLWPLYGSFII